MKLSTKARYGLRMMVELARELKTNQLVRLGKIAQITGLSVNYLAQLAIPLKAKGLLVGVSGKYGGYRLSRSANQILISDVVGASIGKINLVECVGDPSICLNSSFCETRLIWVILNESFIDALKKYTLADLINKGYREKMRKNYPNISLLHPDKIMASMDDEVILGCPMQVKNVGGKNN